MTRAVRGAAIKPLASLSASLLGRRGSARRAPLSLARIPVDAETPTDPHDDAGALPDVARQVARLTQAFEIDPAPTSAPDPASTGAIVPAASVARRRIAFTLRLDPARHVRLRELAAIRGCSGQSLLTHLLDNQFPDAAGTGPSEPSFRTFHGKQP